MPDFAKEKKNVKSLQRAQENSRIIKEKSINAHEKRKLPCLIKRWSKCVVPIL